MIQRLLEAELAVKSPFDEAYDAEDDESRSLR
jgi:hypothetical protein